MTVVAQGNNWYIETFDITRSALAATTTSGHALTLERPGVFLGGTAVIDADVTNADSETISLILRNTDNSFISFGSNITALELIRNNSSAGSVTFGAHVTIFLRKP